MKTASALFTANDKQTIATSIAEAEKSTAAEIVPIVATVSGRYDRAEDIFGVLCAIAGLCLAWMTLPLQSESSWSYFSLNELSLPLATIIVIVGFVFGATLATRFPALRLPFISRSEMLEEVERRAVEMFQRQRIRDTAESTGVLIYVSLYERLIKVTGDDAVNEKLDQSALEEICGLVVDGLAKDEPTQGLSNAILRTGELLSAVLPIASEDTNELTNELILLD